MAISQGTKLGRYEIRSILGAGGMGEVYLADDLSLHRKVAIKVLRAEVISDRERLRRFELEAFAASSLNHPNILTIHEIGHESGHHFMATEFVEGVSLGQRLKGQTLTLHEILEVGIQIASALAAAHAAGITHRDIKPDNIMLRRDHLVKVLDFGLAKLSEPGSAMDKEAPLTMPGMVMGTARYMSPEQARGLPVDERTDIWSLGVVLYEMVGGHLPFTGRTMSDVIAAVLTMHPPLLAKYRPDVPAELERIAAKALRKDVEERYQVVKDLELDLKSLKQRVEFEAELERSGEGRRSGEAKSALDSPAHPQTAETLVAEKLKDSVASHVRSASGEASVSDLAADLTRVKRNTDPQTVVTAPADGETRLTTRAAVGTPNISRLTSFARQRWKALAAIAVFGIVVLAAIGVYWRLHKPSVKLTDKDTIVLSDFTNTTGNSVFDGTLRQGLTVQLEQSPFLSLVSEQRIQQTLRLMGQPPDAKLTQDTSREICQRTGSTAVIDGSIASLGSQYVLGLKALSCRSGDALAVEQVTAEGKEGVLKALGEAATKLREKVGESLSTVQRFDTPLEQATTPSIEALQAYSFGRKTMAEKGGFAAAVPLFQRAISLDPNFAMAYALLGTSYGNLGEASLGAVNIRRAYELRERRSEREKFYIDAKYYVYVNGDLEKTRQTYELWEQTYPRDFVPHNNVGELYGRLGQYDKYLEEAHEALSLEENSFSYISLMTAYINLNRLEEARTTAEAANAKNFESPGLHFILYELAYLQNDTAEMAQQAAWSAGKPGSEDILLALEAATAAHSGRLKEAREFSHRAVASAERAGEKETAASYEADAAVWEALCGNAFEARQRAVAALALSPGRYAEYEAALALALVGDAARAQALAGDLGKRFPLSTAVQFRYLPTIQAQLALDRNNVPKAIEALQTAAPYELGTLGSFDLSSALYPIYLRGTVYLAGHQGSEAAAEFEKILDHRGVVLNQTTGALAHLGLARAYAIAGEPAKARTAYQDFFAIWKDADSDIPILKDARVEYEKLK